MGNTHMGNTEKRGDMAANPSSSVLLSSGVDPALTRQSLSPAGSIHTPLSRLRGRATIPRWCWALARRAAC